MWKSVAVCALLLAAGCTYMAEQADQIYADRCQALGLEPGSDRFAECVAHERSEEQREAQRARQMRQDLIGR
jgi:hypothetical protein